MGGPLALRSRTAARPRPADDAAGFSPLDVLGRRLRDLSPDGSDTYSVTDLGSRPGSVAEPVPCSDVGADAPRWLPVSTVVTAMRAGRGAHLQMSPAVAGARLSGTLGYAAVGRAAVALAVTGQVYDTGPDSLLIQVDADGLVDRIGVRNPRLVVSADDPLAGHPATLALADRTAVIDWAASRAWATLEPLIEEVHELTRYGRVPMWNLVADTVLGPATEAARRAGLGGSAGRAVGHALLDALVARGAAIRRRGTLLSLGERPPGEDQQISVRGACCLYYRQTGDKCAGCPLVTR